MEVTCEYIRERLLEIAGPEGPPPEVQPAVLRHLASCADCREEVAQLRHFLELAGSAATVAGWRHEGAPPDAQTSAAIERLRRRVAENVAVKSSIQSTGGVAATSTQPVSTSSRTSLLEDFLRGIFSCLFPPLRLDLRAPLAAAGGETPESVVPPPRIERAAHAELGAEIEVVLAPGECRLFLRVSEAPDEPIPLVLTLTAEGGYEVRMEAELVRGEAEAELPDLGPGVISIQVQVRDRAAE